MFEKLEELGKLNEKFYELYGNLSENRKFLGDNKTYQLFSTNLLEQYKAEYEILKIRFETIEKPKLYAAQVRHGELVPRNHFFFFRNRAKKLIDNEILLELDKYFNEREKALERLISALENEDSAEQETKAFNEPAMSGETPATVIESAERVKDEQPKAEKPTRTRKTREPKEPNNAQLSGQVSIEEINSGNG